MNERYLQSHLIDIVLPPAIILPHIQLVLLYTLSMLLDIALLKNKRALFLTSRQLFSFIFVTRALFPLFFVSPNSPVNILYLGVPWFYALFYTRMPLHELPWVKIIENLIYVTAEPAKLSSSEIRSNGFVKCCFGALKYSIIPLLIDPLLSYRSYPPIYYPWFHPIKLVCTFLYGTKMFCSLSLIDVALGLAQMCLGINMIRMFDSPFLATSPKDFWGRWNGAVRKVLHGQVFLNSNGLHKSDPQREKSDKKPSVSTIFDNKYIRGMEAFVLSGLFHEMIVMSVFRRITLENLMFFIIQGVSVALEVKLNQGKSKKEIKGIKQLLCILGVSLFFSCTGQLYFDPYIRNF